MAKKNLEAQPSSSSSEEEGSPAAASLSAADDESPEGNTIGSGSDSDDFERPLKSIVSKPVDDGSKLKRPRSRPNSKPNLAASPMKTPTKRPTAAAAGKDSKKSRTEKEKGAEEEEEKKSVLFQRLWSDDDEVAILEGMIDYKEQKGADPMADANGFHDFIKDSVHINVDRRQVVDKVRRLKKRYKNSSLKKKVSNPHEQRIIELSKKVWGQKTESEDLDQENKSNKKSTRTISKDAPATTINSAENGETESPARNKPSATSNGKKEAGNSSEEEKVGNSFQFIGKASVSMGLDENIVNAGLELCSEDRKAEIEEKWRKLHLEESDLFLRKLDLVRQESEMITAALRSGGE